jgi:hypothetical protein
VRATERLEAVGALFDEPRALPHRVRLHHLVSKACLKPGRGLTGGPEVRGRFADDAGDASRRVRKRPGQQLRWLRRKG